MTFYYSRAGLFESRSTLTLGLKVNRGNNFSCVKVLSIANVLCSLRLLMLKTEGHKIETDVRAEKVQKRNQNSR